MIEFSEIKRNSDDKYDTDDIRVLLQEEENDVSVREAADNMQADDSGPDSEENAADYILFRNEEERVAFLQKVGLLGVSGKKRKPFLYKGIYASEPTECKIVGYAREYNVPYDDGRDDPWADLVIDVNGRLYVICSAYLKEMQIASFARNQETDEW